MTWDHAFDMERFKCVSPLDYRYYGGDDGLFRDLGPYLSEEANIRYIFRVEWALARALVRRKLAPAELVSGIESAMEKIHPREVYEEDRRVHHYLKAAVNVLKAHVPETLREFIHLGATSFDVVDTANAVRLRECYENVIHPKGLALVKVLMEVARREKGTVQVGRTHGRFASPVTFGYFLSGYVDRFGTGLREMESTARRLVGKLSGAVGSYNALSLLVEDPADMEREVLADLGIEPALHSTQIVQPEYMARFVCAVIVAFGVLANLADDLRHLHRSEIDEVLEPFGAAQVGSSTMPHKRNPWNLEHVKSQYKAFMPRAVTVFLDQVSEHQRDLTNSASGRYVPEVLVGFYDALCRMVWILEGLEIRRDSLNRNLEEAIPEISSEPLYIALSLAGIENAHEVVRRASHARTPQETVCQALEREESLRRRLEEVPSKALASARNPRTYTGMAESRTQLICETWERRLFGSGESAG